MPGQFIYLVMQQYFLPLLIIYSLQEVLIPLVAFLFFPLPIFLPLSFIILTSLQLPLSTALQ